MKTCTPRLNSFIFMQFLPIILPKAGAPLFRVVAPPLWEILDPPLPTSVNLICSVLTTNVFDQIYNIANIMKEKLRMEIRRPCHQPFD